MFGCQIVVLRGSQTRRALTTDGHAGSLQNTCFTMFQPLGHEKRHVFQSLRCDGSDSQVCRMIGLSWSSKMAQNCSRGLPFDVTF